MIEVKFNFASVSDMQAAFAQLSAHTHAPAATQPPAAVQAQAEKAIEKATKVSAKKPSPSETAAPAATPIAAEPAVNTEPTAPATTASESPSEPAITLEAVRAKLAELSQAGKTAEVKALISQCGATKLTEIPADKYAEVLEKAAAL